MPQDTLPLMPLPENPHQHRPGARLSVNGKPLGRPPNARNKRSTDLGRYIEAMFGGMTPGQQAAELSMVKPRDLAKAKQLARELGIIDLDLPAHTLAMVVKAEQLAKALGVKRVDAWILLQKERADLLPYIHQRQAPKEAPKAGGAMVQAFLIPEGEAAGHQALADFSENDGLEIIEELPLSPAPVGRSQSDDDT